MRTFPRSSFVLEENMAVSDIILNINRDSRSNGYPYVKENVVREVWDRP